MRNLYLWFMRKWVFAPFLPMPNFIFMHVMRLESEAQMERWQKKMAEEELRKEAFFDAHRN